MSFATARRCIVSPEGGVEVLQRLERMRLGKSSGFSFEVDAEAFRVGEDGLAGVGQLAGRGCFHFLP